jgi:peptidyl-prolyl cis-trans isomerase D
MYDAKVGEVSPVFSMEGRYIIAKLTGIQEKGLMKLDASNRPMIESMVKAEKKAEIIKNKYKSMNSVDAISQASAQPLQNLDSFNAASTYVPNLGFEPKVVGYTFYDGFKPNATSPAIKGQDGMFYISLKMRQQNPTLPGGGPVMTQQMQQQQMQLKNQVSGMLPETMKRGAKVKYNAKNLY